MKFQPEVDGRGLSQPTVEVDTFADRVALCVDDANCPEFWLRLELTAPELIHLLRGIVNAQMDAQDEGHDLLDELEVNLGIGSCLDDDDDQEQPGR